MKSLLALFTLLAITGATHAAGGRHALILCNQNYSAVGALKTPLAEAEEASKTLATLGFQGNITVVTDASTAKMTEAVDTFTAKLTEADVALFFYGGHAIQAAGENYLLGVDSDPATTSQLAYKALPLGRVLTNLEGSGARLNLLILDCCRNNPLPTRGRNVGSTRGLAPMANAPKGTFIAYAADANQQAWDDHGQIGLYGSVLFEKMKTPGLRLEDIFIQTRDVVARLATEKYQHQQEPAEYSKVSGAFYFLPGGEVPVLPAPTSDPLAGVSKNAPFQNSLGMAFVPAGTPGVLFSVWETRVGDFSAFVEDSGHDAIKDSPFGAPAFTLEKTADGKGAEWAQKGGSWRDPRFPTSQTAEHPVVCISYLDAEAFCAWLTKKDREARKIPATASYRLPTDSEWSRAAGGGEFPWGDNFPPAATDGNYCGKEAMVGVYEGFSNELVKGGYRDSAARTSPAGMFTENRYGLHDMGGNVWEWCSTWYTASLNDDEAKKAVPVLADDKGGQTYRVLRGASWNYYVRVSLRSAFRISEDPRDRDGNSGFRVVLVVAGG